MASSTKKRADDEKQNNRDINNDSDDHGDSDMEEELMDQEMEVEFEARTPQDSDFHGIKTLLQQEMEVEFEARTPQDSDFHGIKTLLQQAFLKANINLSELTDIVISQNYIGTVIKQLNDDEDDDSNNEFDDGDPVFGMMSVINLTERKKDNECIKQLLTWLTGKCEQTGERGQKVADVINNDDMQVGMLINERFLNIPVSVAAPSYESLRKDMAKANNKNMKYDFSYYVLLSKCYRNKLEGEGDNNTSNEMFYSNPEDDLLKELSELEICFSVKAERDDIAMGAWEDDDCMEPMRTVFIFSADQYDSIINVLKTQIDA